jgi:hypothetical protein
MFDTSKILIQFALRYQGYPALRAGVLLCEQQCKDGVLDYRFDETLASSTDGPMVRGASLG